VTNFLRKFFSRQRDPLPTDEEDTALTKFYTDSEYPLQVFEQLAATTSLPRHLLVIHGIGGVGKSTLLKMYNLSCRRHHVSAGLVASEEALSPVDILADWANDLSHNSITLPVFYKTLNHYRAIQAKVEAEVNKSNQTGSKLASTLGKTAAKTAISVATSAIPIVGPLVGPLVGESAEAFLDWLRSFLPKPDIELYLDPVGRLEKDFLSDLTRVAAQQRIVLMVDTYEQMTSLDEWMCEFIRRLPKNVLIVIAGRLVPEWNRAWPGWMGRAEIVELKEMTPEDLRILVYRYYAYIRNGEPDPRQVEAIVQFARGLPMVATTVVQLWAKYSAEDFQLVRPQVLADLTDRLLEGVPQEMRPALEAAAILRYFNVDTLNALLDGQDVEELYIELRRWPFIRSRKEGLAVHDTIREMINEALRIRTPKRYLTLHEQAAAYYEALLEKGTGEELERYLLERLYHHVSAEEHGGMQLFQELAEELDRYRLVNQLRALLNDVNSYLLKTENSHLWRTYYNARLAYMEGQLSRAEAMYQAIGENKHVESKLRAYALCDWGEILSRRDRLRQPGVEEKAVHLLKLSLDIGGPPNVKLAMSWVYLSDIYTAKADWEKALFYLKQPKEFFTEHHDYSGLLSILEYERGIYVRQGDLRKMFDIAREMEDIYTALGHSLYLRTRISPIWGWVWAGRYAEQERRYRDALAIAKSAQDQEYLLYTTTDLALCLGFQGKCAEALAAAEEGLSLARSLGSIGETVAIAAHTRYGIVCLKCGILDKAEEYLLQSIAIARKIHAHHGEYLLYLGITYEILKRFDQAAHFYQLLQAEVKESGRNYHMCGALAGLVRVKHAENVYNAIPPLWTEAKRLAQKYEYNDYLASLWLTRGHMTWDEHISTWTGGFDSAAHFYKLALIHALRSNRFLLDEMLSGREHGTSLQPIVPYCLERGKEGRQMLVALREWWQNGINDIGVARPDTISPFPEGISLIEAERMARDREPGDGSQQRDVVEQINVALAIVDRD
jgi:ATP/maltotriose-dependent transcriptional regulator MalT